MIRQLIQALDEIGHINPILFIDEILSTGANGGGVRIGWYAGAAANGLRLLRAHGVRTWGYRMAYDSDRRWCMVRKRQAKWAVGLLRGAGYGVFEGPASPPIRPRTNWGAPAPAQGFAGLVAKLFIGSK
jgi:hypothetical protein